MHLPLQLNSQVNSFKIPGHADRQVLENRQVGSAGDKVCQYWKWEKCACLCLTKTRLVQYAELIPGIQVGFDVFFVYVEHCTAPL